MAPIELSSEASGCLALDGSKVEFEETLKMEIEPLKKEVSDLTLKLAISYRTSFWKNYQGKNRLIHMATNNSAQPIKFVLGFTNTVSSVYSSRLAINLAAEQGKKILFLSHQTAEAQKKFVHDALRLGDSERNLDPSNIEAVKKILPSVKFIHYKPDNFIFSEIVNVTTENKITCLDDYVIVIGDDGDTKHPDSMCLFNLNMLVKKKGVSIVFHKTIHTQTTLEELQFLKQFTIVSRPIDEIDGYSTKEWIFN